MHTFTNSSNSLTSVDISKDGAIIAAGFSDSFIRVYIQDPDFVLDFEQGLENKVNVVQFEDKKAGISPGGNTRKRELLLIGHSSSVMAISISPLNYFIISGSLDCTIRLWSIHTNSTLMIYKGHTFPIWDLKFSPLGYYFASGAGDRMACIWRTSTEYPIRSLIGHLGDIETVEFHPNMQYVATGSNDKTIRMYY